MFNIPGCPSAYLWVQGPLCSQQSHWLHRTTFFSCALGLIGHGSLGHLTSSWCFIVSVFTLLLKKNPRSYVVVELKLPTYPRMALNFLFPCLYPPSAGNAGISSHAQLEKFTVNADDCYPMAHQRAYIPSSSVCLLPPSLLSPILGFWETPASLPRFIT